MKKIAKVGTVFSFLLTASLLVNGVSTCAKESQPENEIVTDKKIVKEVLFSSDNKQEEKKDVFSQTLKRNGKTYHLETVAYEVADQTPVSVKKETTKLIESDPLPEGQAYEPSETIEENGVTYTLKEVKEKEAAGDVAVQTVNGYTDYDRAVTAADVPATKVISTTNSMTGEEMEVTCSLSGIETITDSAWEDTYIDIVFESYDSNIFRWNGVTVTKDTNTPLKGYEAQLLSSVGATQDNYRVNQTYWTSDPYTDADGIVCRNARADVQRKITRYRANYHASVPAGNGTVYEAVYEGSETITDPDRFVYTIRATATYALASGISPIMVGVGVAILILLLVLILFWIWKNKKRKEEVNG